MDSPLYLTKAGLFFAAHSGKTWPERFNDIDAYMVYASIDKSGCWQFEDGSRLVPEVQPHEVWVDTGLPVVRLVPHPGGSA